MKSDQTRRRPASPEFERLLSKEDLQIARAARKEYVRRIAFDRACLSDETIAQCVDGAAIWQACLHAFHCPPCRETIIDLYRSIHPEEKRLPLWMRMAQLGHSASGHMMPQVPPKVSNAHSQTEAGVQFALASSASESFDSFKKDFLRRLDLLKNNTDFQKYIEEGSNLFSLDLVETTAPAGVSSETALATFTAVWESTDGNVRKAQVDLLQAPLISPKGGLTLGIRVRDALAKPEERIALVVVRSDGVKVSEAVEVPLGGPQTVTIPLPPEFENQKAWLNYADFPFRFVILALKPEVGRTCVDESGAWKTRDRSETWTKMLKFIWGVKWCHST